MATPKSTAKKVAKKDQVNSDPVESDNQDPDPAVGPDTDSVESRDLIPGTNIPETRAPKSGEMTR